MSADSTKEEVLRIIEEEYRKSNRKRLALRATLRRIGRLVLALPPQLPEQSVKYEKLFKDPKVIEDSLALAKKVYDMARDMRSRGENVSSRKIGVELGYEPGTIQFRQELKLAYDAGKARRKFPEGGIKRIIEKRKT